MALEVKEIKRSGVSIVDNLSRVKFREGDTLCYGQMIHLSLHGETLLYSCYWPMAKIPSRKLGERNVGLH